MSQRDPSLRQRHTARRAHNSDRPQSDRPHTDTPRLLFSRPLCDAHITLKRLSVSAHTPMHAPGLYACCRLVSTHARHRWRRPAFAPSKQLPPAASRPPTRHTVGRVAVRARAARRVTSPTSRCAARLPARPLSLSRHCSLCSVPLHPSHQSYHCRAARLPRPVVPVTRRSGSAPPSLPPSS